jgi:hypothetical protein
MIKKSLFYSILFSLVIIYISYKSLGETTHNPVQTTQGKTQTLLRKDQLNPSKNTLKTPSSLPHFSVLTFGAIGDGIIDDTNSIQKTIDAAAAKGNAVVMFPPGIYKVQIQSQHRDALKIYPNIILQGQENQKSVIKLANNQGDYNAIIAGLSPVSDLSNFAIYDLTIDGNSINNKVSSENNFKNSKFRYAVQIFAGKEIHIENSKFINFDNINTISMNGESVSDIYIQNNRFESIGDSNIDHDHSTIYLHGKNGKIINNVFKSWKGAGTRGARTAIEIHGDAHIVSGNQISGFANGIFVTGYAASSKNQVIKNNKIDDAHSGVIIWSFIYKNNEPKVAIENCEIADNLININVADWRSLWGNSPNQGIALESNSDSSINNLKIIDNEVRFMNIDAGRRSDTLATGINLWRYSHPKTLSHNIYIAKNRIINALSAGLYIAMPIDILEISENQFFNPGQSKYSFHQNYRSAMIIGTPNINLQVKNNQFIDNQVINTLKIGMVWAGDCPKRCVENGNTLRIKSGANLPHLVKIP